MIDRLATLAAELLGREIYLLASSVDQLPAGRIMPGCWGMTGRQFDVSLKDHLVATGRWTGRRPAVWLDDAAIGRWAQDECPSRSEADALAAEITLGALIHELGHVADSGVDSSEITPTKIEYAACVAEFSIGTAGELPNYPPFFGHSASWIRDCLHLRIRGCLAGHFCDLRWLFDGPSMGLSAAQAYCNALEFEPQRHLDCSVFDLSEIEPPATFRELWQSDVERWADAQPNVEGAAADYLDRQRMLYSREQMTTVRAAAIARRNLLAV